MFVVRDTNLTTMRLMMQIFLDVTQCHSANGFHRFKWTQYLHQAIQQELTLCPSEHMTPLNLNHCVTSQKTWILYNRIPLIWMLIHQTSWYFCSSGIVPKRGSLPERLPVVSLFRLMCYFLTPCLLLHQNHCSNRDDSPPPNDPKPAVVMQRGYCLDYLCSSSLGAVAKYTSFLAWCPDIMNELPNHMKCSKDEKLILWNSVLLTGKICSYVWQQLYVEWYLIYLFSCAVSLSCYSFIFEI
jgi:hypothetical protein